MRVHGKRFAKKYIDSRVQTRVETRDAIVWSVDTINNVARCKIQGSDEFIYAHYPRNWKKIPYWLKTGNAVAIRHRQGIRGYTEITGEGRAIPTPISGEVFPPMMDLPDGILSGMYVSETYPISLGCLVSNGWYRLNATEYFFTAAMMGYTIMDDPAPMVMGSLELMGQGNYNVSFGTPIENSGEWRYDIMVIGEDQVIDVISGEVGISGTIPVAPEVPSDHIQIGEDILWGHGDNYFTLDMMGKVYDGPRPSLLKTFLYSSANGEIVNDTRFVWRVSGESGWPTPHISIVVEVWDQYGSPIPAGTGGYTITLERDEDIGTGVLMPVGGQWMSEPPYYVEKYVPSLGYSATFLYKRDQTKYEEQPLIVAKFGEHTVVETYNQMKMGVPLQLLDSSGAPVSGEW